MDADSPDLQPYQEAVQYLDYAYSLEQESNSRAALYACEDAIRRVAPFLAEAYNLRGVLLEQMDRNEEALAVYRLALALKPNFAEAADNLVALEAELDVAPDLVTIARFGQAAEGRAAE
jgi:Flp pilus assembly protein TadD